jgi:hypothetical protein
MRAIWLAFTSSPFGELRHSKGLYTLNFKKKAKQKIGGMQRRLWQTTPSIEVGMFGAI